MFSLSPCPAVLSPYTPPPPPRSSDQSMPVPCPPSRPHPLCTTGSRQGAKALSCPCPATGDAAGHGALGTSTAHAESEVGNWDFFLAFPSGWVGFFYLFVCFKPC